MPVPCAESTGAFDVPRGAPATSFIPQGRMPARGFDEELRRSLRSRLILVHLLALPLHVLLIAVIILTLRAKGASSLIPDPFDFGLAAPLAESLMGTVFLCRK